MGFFDTINSFLHQPKLRADGRKLQQEELQVCAAALLIDVLAADGNFEPAEFDSLMSRLRKTFALKEEAAADLISSADALRSEPAKLNQLIEKLSVSLSADEKGKIERLLLDIASADGQVDAAEEAKIREIRQRLH